MGRMLRMLLAGALFAIVAPACAKTPAAAEARVAAAGKVTTVTGHVTVTPAGGAAHAANSGDAIASDDTIATDADARIEIVLARNQALLHLDGGQTVRLDASLAWSLPQQTGSAVGPSSAGLASAGHAAENDVAQTTAPAPAGEPPLAEPVAPARPPTAVAIPSKKPSGAPHAVVTPRSQIAVSDVGGANDPGAPAPSHPLTITPPAVAPSPVALHPSAAQLATIRGCFAKPAANDAIILRLDAAHAVIDATYNGQPMSATDRACLTTALAPLAAREGRYVLSL